MPFWWSNGARCCLCLASRTRCRPGQGLSRSAASAVASSARRSAVRVGEHAVFGPGPPSSTSSPGQCPGRDHPAIRPDPIRPGRVGAISVKDREAADRSLSGVRPGYGQLWRERGGVVAIRRPLVVHLRRRVRVRAHDEQRASRRGRAGSARPDRRAVPTSQVAVGSESTQETGSGDRLATRKDSHSAWCGDERCDGRRGRGAAGAAIAISLTPG